jgi:hypothetical protein
MRLGLVSLYSFRPHVEHLYYVSTLLKEAGHELFFLTCDGALDNCYGRALKGTSKLAECPTCMAGGIRSFPVSQITSVRAKHRVDLSEDERNLLASSSACTLLRTETEADTHLPDYLALRETFYKPVETMFGNAAQWIKNNQLEGVICFNGRMDGTRAITYACEQLDIPYLTMERPWFSDGLQFIPQANCLSLKDVDRLNIQYRDVPLTARQAGVAAQLIASRFVRTNLKEWRAYNLNATQADWPTDAVVGPKVLILPSSRNEFQGHPEQESGWDSYVEGFELVLASLGIPAANVVLRCHPNWSEKIGIADGTSSERYYADWAKGQGIRCIGARETASTFDLIQQCDILLVNGSSAAFEAGACGKKIICLGHSTYQEAGIAVHLDKRSELHKLQALEQHEPLDVIRRTLRYGYTMARRFAQFTDYVEALTPTRYRYFAGADADRIVRALCSGMLEADDSEVAADDRSEMEVVAKMLDKKWDQLAVFDEARPVRPEIDIGRRVGLRWLDRAREKLPTGDLWHGK